MTDHTTPVLILLILISIIVLAVGHRAQQEELLARLTERSAERAAEVVVDTVHYYHGPLTIPDCQGQDVIECFEAAGVHTMEAETFRLEAEDTYLYLGLFHVPPWVQDTQPDTIWWERAVEPQR